MNRSRMITIARWEYLQKVRSKGFLLSLIFFPIMMLGFGFVPSILINQGPGETKQVGVIDHTNFYATQISLQLESGTKLDDGTPAWVAKVYSDSSLLPDSLFAQAVSDAESEATEGFLEISGSRSAPEFVWRSPNLSDLRVAEVVENSVQSAVTGERIRESGIDSAEYATLMIPVEVKQRKLTAEGEDESSFGKEFMTTFLTAFVGIILFMILIMTTGQSLVRGLVEEKSNRIMEILIGTVTPSELMWGKLLGLSALGLTQVAVWGILGALGSFFFISSGAATSDVLTGVLTTLPLILLYLTLGYIFYASLFIGVGSLVTTEQEAQLVTQYLTIFLVAPLAFAAIVMQDPNAGYVEALSYVPFLTPTLMMLRVVVKMPSVFTLIGTTAVLMFSTIATTWAAAKVFRVAILLYGKRPSVREVMRWVRS
ncbi:MAG: ABC transporter permease [Candidatus Kapaibacterium sp.]